MREVPLSLSEYNFVVKALSESQVIINLFHFELNNIWFTKTKKRLDKRQIYDVRETKIEFFKTRGACIVSLGETKVSAQVSSEILKPKETRPNEGLLRINLEIDFQEFKTSTALRISVFFVYLFCSPKFALK